jgi:ribosome-binding factor A
MGLRQERLADQIRDVVAFCFLGDTLQDPRLSGVTITHVRVSPDLQFASIYFRLFDKKDLEGAEKALVNCRGYFRKKIADAITLRRVPDLRFLYDESVERGSHIEGLIRQIKQNE